MRRQRQNCGGVQRKMMRNRMAGSKLTSPVGASRQRFHSEVPNCGWRIYSGGRLD